MGGPTFSSLKLGIPCRRSDPGCPDARDRASPAGGQTPGAQMPETRRPLPEVRPRVPRRPSPSPHTPRRAHGPAREAFALPP